MSPILNAPSAICKETPGSIRNGEIRHIVTEVLEALDLHAVVGDRIDEIIEKDASFHLRCGVRPPRGAGRVLRSVIDAADALEAFSTSTP
jgi:hypothetical protein